jgi:hypothetical protein
LVKGVQIMTASLTFSIRDVTPLTDDRSQTPRRLTVVALGNPCLLGVALGGNPSLDG